MRVSAQRRHKFLNGSTFLHHSINDSPNTDYTKVFLTHKVLSCGYLRGELLIYQEIITTAGLMNNVGIKIMIRNRAGEGTQKPIGDIGK